MTREESLRAIPVRRPCVEQVALADGGRRIEVEADPGKWQRRILRIHGTIRKSYELDRLGVFVLDQCDGKRNVLDVIKAFEKAYTLDRAESERAVLVFMKTLVMRGLVDLVVPR
jgi:hypothetical protein